VDGDALAALLYATIGAAWLATIAAFVSAAIVWRRAHSARGPLLVGAALAYVAVAAVVFVTRIPEGESAELDATLTYLRVGGLAAACTFASGVALTRPRTQRTA
jgi:hypothetical protein